MNTNRNEIMNTEAAALTIKVVSGSSAYKCLHRLHLFTPKKNSGVNTITHAGRALAKMFTPFTPYFNKYYNNKKIIAAIGTTIAFMKYYILFPILLRKRCKRCKRCKHFAITQ